MMNKKTLRFFLLALAAILIIPSLLFGASFDCSKASTKAEKAICEDAILSKLDDDLAVTYSKALKSSDRDIVKEEQRKWLKEKLAPCNEDKACIKKVYENRLQQLNVFPSLTGPVSKRPAPPSPAPASANLGKELPTTKPLACAQCGVWQGDDIGMLVIDDKRIIIPGCGVFDYKVEEYASTPEPQRRDRNNYKVSMLLKQHKTSFLCNNKDEKNWYLEADISGHFQEGGTAVFKLRKSKSAVPTLWFDGWNMDREDPCDAGSGRGTAACFAIESSLVYRMLSDRVEKAYRLLNNIQIKTLPDFNAARFSVIVDQFCTDRHKESGGGSWPHAHAIGCQLGILEEKFKEFASWQTCMEKTSNKLASCKFPDESFNRSPKQEEEE